MRHGRKRAGVVVLAVLVLLAATALLLWKYVFVMRNVVIEGTVTASGDEIIRMARLDLGGSIFAADEEAARRQLESDGRFALDGMRTELPSTVILTVRERTRDGMTTCGGNVLVLDSDGYVVEICSAIPEDCAMYVRGLNGTSYALGRRIVAPEDQLEAMKTVLEAVRRQSAGDYLSELNVENPLHMTMISRTGIKIILGDASDVESKLIWARSAIADLESRGETRGTLDVSSGSMADYRPES